MPVLQFKTFDYIDKILYRTCKHQHSSVWVNENFFNNGIAPDPQL